MASAPNDRSESASAKEPLGAGGQRKRAGLRDAWILLKPHAKPILPVMVLVFVLGILAALGETAPIFLLEPTFGVALFPDESIGIPTAGGRQAPEQSWVVQSFTSLRDSVLGRAAAPGDEDGRLVVLVIASAALVLAALVAGVAQYFYARISGWISLRLVVDLRLRVTRHLMGLSVHYHGRLQLGDLLSRVSADVQLTLSAIRVFFHDFCQNLLKALSWLAVAFVAAPLLSVSLIVCLPILAVPVSILAKRVRRRSTRSLETLGSSVQALSQMFQGIRTVKAFRGEEREVERYRKINEAYLADAMGVVRTVSLSQGWALLFSNFGFAVILVSVGWATIRFDFFDGQEKLLMFFLANAQFYSHAKRVTRAATALEEAVGAADRLSQVLEEEQDVRESEHPVALHDLGDGIRFEHVSMVYPEGDGRPALDDVTLSVEPGQVLAVVGPSGSGKSTLAGLICRFFDPTGGRVTVDGNDLREVGLDDWTQLYSMVDQSPFLFHTSVDENIRYGKPDATRSEVEEAARAASIHEFITSLPDGYETDVEEGGSRFSGGQRQRITIARSILKGAPLLILDEATSSLDSESELAIQGALESLMHERTVIVIAHRLSTIRNADKVAVLEAGRLVEYGSYNELLALDGVFARLANSQALAADD